MEAIEDRIRHQLILLPKISALDANAIWSSDVMLILEIIGGVSSNQANKS
jgi:hypothetical protein